MQLAVHGVLAEIPSSLKRNMAKNILDILIKHRGILTWNRHGVLIKPKNSSVGKLKNLIANLIYSNRGAPHVNKTIAHIISPIFQEIKDLVINKRVLTYIPSHMQAPSKPTKNKKNNKSYLTMK